MVTLFILLLFLREVIVLDSKHIITSASVELDLNLLANAFIKDKRDNENAALLSYFADTAKYKYKAVWSVKKILFSTIYNVIFIFNLLQFIYKGDDS